MARYKMINGERVPLSQSEESALNDLQAELSEQQKRNQLRDQFISEALSRIQSHVAWIDTIEEVTTTARLAMDGVLDLSGNTAYQNARSIFVYVVDDILPDINAIPAQDLDVIDPSASDPFVDASFDGTSSDPGPWPA